MIISRNKDDDEIEIKGQAKKSSDAHTITCSVNKKSKKYIIEDHGNVLWLSERRINKKDFKHYVPGKTKLMIKVDGQTLAPRVIRHVHLIVDPLNEKHKHCALVKKFWSMPLSAIPHFLFKITLEQVKQSKGKSKNSKRKK